MSTLYFIRHAQGSFGSAEYDRLSPLGRRQAELLARYFDRVQRRFDAVYTGRLRRHEETAEALFESYRRRNESVPRHVRLDGLDEYPTEEIFRRFMPLALERDRRLESDVTRMMEDRRSFQRVFERIMGMWAAGEHYPQGLVTWKEFAEGVHVAVNEIMRRDGRGKNVAVVTSGGPISVTVCRVWGLTGPASVTVAEQLVNTSISRFKCTEDRIMLSTFNEYPHLELDGAEGAITYR